MPSATQELELFAKDALSRGLGRQSILTAMMEAGWTKEQAQSALAAYADVAFPVPIPKPRPQLSARDAFVYLLLFTTLYLSAFHLGKLLFHFIDRAYPDRIVSGRAPYLLESVRWSVSVLIIVFPTFSLLSFYVARDVARNPVKRLSPIRRWLTYLTLFIASVALIVDLAALVYSAMAGELTIRVILKVLVVLLISAVVFAYYLIDLRKEERE